MFGSIQGRPPSGVTAHAAIAGAHHARYTGAEAVTAVEAATLTLAEKLTVSDADGDIAIGDITAGVADTDAGLMMDGAGSFESALFTEVNGEVLSYAINTPQITTRNTTRVGGIFRMDIRTAYPEFVIGGYAAGGSVFTRLLACNLQTAGVTIGCPDTAVARSLGLRQTNNDDYGFDFDLETVSVGRLDFYRVVNTSRTRVYSINRGTGKWTFDSDVELDAALDHDGSTVGFYGTAPIAKQTGVAVTAAGLHAALVNLGLIAA